MALPQLTTIRKCCREVVLYLKFNILFDETNDATAVSKKKFLMRIPNLKPLYTWLSINV